MSSLVAWCLNFRCSINLGCFSHPFWALTLDLEGSSFFVLLLKICSLFSSSHVLQENHCFFTSRASVTQLCLDHAYLFLHYLCLIFSLDFLCDWDACLSRLFCCVSNFSPLAHYNCCSHTWCTSNFELCLLSALIFLLPSVGVYASCRALLFNLVIALFSYFLTHSRIVLVIRNVNRPCEKKLK